VQPNAHLLANTQIATKLEVIDARPAITNCLEAKPSFTQDVVGLLFMRQQVLMLWN
jgi:hypothetical protein